MPVTFPILALAALVAASVIAKRMSYALTSASLMVITGALALWVAALVLLHA